MKVAEVGGRSRVEVRERPKPVPGPGDILVKMHSCGICGSDIEKVYGEYGQPSTRLGHEPAGTVVETGGGVEGFTAGDRVFTHHHVPCNSCYLCRRGSETLCERYRKSNLAPCGLAQEYLVPAWNVERGGVIRLPDSVSFGQAAMIEPLACCVRAWSRCGHQRGDSAAIFGVGSAGMMHAMLARHYGLSGAYCVDVNGFRLEFARRMGADGAFAADESVPDTLRGLTGGRGVDLAMVATGSMAALQSAILSVRHGGTVMMFGVPSRGQTALVDMNYIYSREISIKSSYAATDADTRAALELIRDGKVDAGRLITHRYDISESQRAFDHAKSGTDAMKIVITGAKA